jgi:hypothetical protein
LFSIIQALKQNKGQMMPLMTKEEFVAYAHEVLSPEAMESLYERISEHNGEVAAFGDSWPGALVSIHRSIAEVRSIERQLARLEGRAERKFHFNVRHPA